MVSYYTMLHLTHENILRLSISMFFFLPSSDKIKDPLWETKKSNNFYQKIKNYKKKLKKNAKNIKKN